jgi:hypothetical protein
MMKATRRSQILTWLTALSLLVSPCAGLLVGNHAQAAPRRDSAREQKVSPSFTLQGGRSSDERLQVILQLRDRMSGQLNALLNRNGNHVRSEFRNFNSLAVELPASAIDELASFDEVDYASEDSEVRSFGELSMTTGADAARFQTAYTEGLTRSTAQASASPFSIPASTTTTTRSPTRAAARCASS